MRILTPTRLSGLSCCCSPSSHSAFAFSWSTNPFLHNLNRSCLLSSILMRGFLTFLNEAFFGLLFLLEEASCIIGVRSKWIHRFSRTFNWFLINLNNSWLSIVGFTLVFGYFQACLWTLWWLLIWDWLCFHFLIVLYTINEVIHSFSSILIFICVLKEFFSLCFLWLFLCRTLIILWLLLYHSLRFWNRFFQFLVAAFLLLFKSITCYRFLSLQLLYGGKLLFPTGKYSSSRWLRVHRRSSLPSASRKIPRYTIHRPMRLVRRIRGFGAFTILIITLN